MTVEGAATMDPATGVTVTAAVSLATMDPSAETASTNYPSTEGHGTSVDHSTEETVTTIVPNTEDLVNTIIETTTEETTTATKDSDTEQTVTEATTAEEIETTTEAAATGTTRAGAAVTEDGAGGRVPRVSCSSADTCEGRCGGGSDLTCWCDDRWALLCYDFHKC